MFKLKILSIYILVLCGLGCCNENTNTTAKPILNISGVPPKLGKIELQYTDTNLPEVKKLLRSLDTFYANRVAMGFNGSVLIGYKGKILYEKYFGKAQQETSWNWDATTASQLASTSKTLTSGAVLLLKDRGLLNFDDPVVNYLPSFPFTNITVRMLLNHRSGLPDYINFASAVWKNENGTGFMTNEDVLNIFSLKVPKLDFAPGTHFKYSNSNFALLACIIEKVSNMPFADFMKKMIFKPLGMNDTYVFVPNEGHRANYCKNYKGNWVCQRDMELDGVAGDKGIYSTVRDMYKWDQALYNKNFIKPATLQEAYQPYSFEKPGIKNYGLGWRMLIYPDGNKIIYHNGYWHGNNTCFYRFIEDNFTIIVLGNKFNKSIYYQPQSIYNLFKGDSQKPVEEFEGEE